jgi:hypothetical protein
MAQHIAGKIKQRDLDPELLSLFNMFIRSGAIDYDDLSYELQEIIRRGGSTGTGGYDDTIIVNQINALIRDKADVSALSNYFNKSTDLVSANMLDNALRAALGLSSTGGTNYVTAADLANYRRIADSIGYDDLDAALQGKFTTIDTRLTGLNNKTQAMQIDISNLQTGLSSVQSTVDHMSAISGGMSTINSTIASMQTQINANASGISTNTQNIQTNASNIASLKTTVDNGLITLDNKLTEDLLAPKIVTKLDQIANLQVSVEALRVNASRITGTVGQIAVISDGTGATVGGDIVCCGLFARDSAQLTAHLSSGAPLVFDLKNQIAYVFDIAGDEVLAPGESSDIADYLATENFLLEYQYTGKFLCDVDTGELLFNNAGTLYVIKPAGADTNVVIAANSSYIYSVEEPYSKNMKVLVLDSDSTSRTYNKYINSEAVATVAYDDTGITIYNDSAESLTFKIIRN